MLHLLVAPYNPKDKEMALYRTLKCYEVNCVSVFCINQIIVVGYLNTNIREKKVLHYSKSAARKPLNLGNFMNPEVEFIFPSSAKITIKLNLVYLFNETQDPCPDGFNQFPCYVVIRGSLPWFCFYLTLRMCSWFKFPEMLATDVVSFTYRLSRGDS